MFKQVTMTLGVCALGAAAVAIAAEPMGLQTLFGENASSKVSDESPRKGISVSPSSKFSVLPSAMHQWMLAGGSSMKSKRNVTPGQLMRIPEAANIADYPVLYGLNSVDDTWQTISPLQSRVYAFHAASSMEFMEASPCDIERPMAAVYAKGRFMLFFSDTETDADWNSTSKTWVKIHDAQTWKLIDSFDLGSGSDMDWFLRQVAAYDESSNKIYLMSWGDTKPLLVVDADTYEVTTLPGDNQFVQTLFLDGKGDLYGITFNEKKLYKIDKTTGKYTEIGELTLPFDITADPMSAIYDPTVDKVYWVPVHRDSKESFLYTIDTSTAEAELVGQIPGGEHLLGLYQPYVRADAAGPATGIEFENGVLKFKAPVKTHASGKDLIGQLTAEIECDGAVLCSKVVNPGEPVEIPVDIADGKHSFRIRFSNGSGFSAERILTKFIGDDVPAAVTGLTLSGDDGKRLSLSWTAPAVSLNGGAVDDNDVNYRVVRMPDGVVVADNLKNTFFSEDVPEAHNRYYYEVTAKAGNRDGATATSNVVTAGSVWFVPYTEEFATQDDFDSFAVVDNNNDGQTWSFLLPAGNPDGMAYLHGNGTADIDTGIYEGNGNDDYLITPYIRLQKNVDYEVSFRTLDQFMHFEHMTVLLGKSRSVAGNETELFSENLIGDSAYSFIFSVPEDGDYTMLLHADNPGQSVNVCIENIGISIYSSFAGPGAVTDVKAVAGAEGKIENTLSFTVPTETYAGGNLSEVTSIHVYRNGGAAPVKVFGNPVPGERITWADKDVEAGSVTYTIVPFNNAGQGKKSTVTNWVGLDIPQTVPNAKIRMNDDFKAVVTFDAVGNVGSHGGYVVPGDVTYALFRYNEYSWIDHWEQVTEFTSDLSITDESLFVYGQEWKDYIVVAANAAGQSAGAGVGTVLGEPYQRPYAESFTYGFSNCGPWTLSTATYNYAWNVIDGSGLSVKPYDNDSGMLQFTYIDADSNPQVIMGPRVYVKDSSTPELTFFMHHGYEAEPEDLVLKVYLNYSDEGWILAKEIPYNDGTTGWGREALPLRKDGRDVQVAFGAYAADASAAIYVDAITIGEGVAKDISLEGIKVSEKRVEAGDKVSVTVTVANYGMEDAGAFDVALLDNDETYATATVEGLATNKKTNVVFDIATGRSDASRRFAFTAVADVDGDSNPDNNSTNVAGLYVKGSNLPAPCNLAGENTGSDMTLQWDAPLASEIRDAAEDDFEAYDSFIIDGIGDWATYDGDGTQTVYFGGPEIPHAYEPKAWQVWAPEEAGFALDKFDVLTPRSGDKYLACWAASNGIDSTLPNDDWLISPEVEGGSDVSFWYRMPNAGSDPQKFEMLYSTTDREPESFVAFDSDEIAFGTDWVYFEFTLPEDALYFAIRSCASGSYTVALLDDITYTPLYGSTSELTLEGYNIYRDDELIAECVADRRYVDRDASGALHTYHVTALWKEGESNYSNGIQNVTLGVGQAHDSTVRIKAAKGVVSVDGVGGNRVGIFTAQGVAVYDSEVADHADIAVANGVYVVRIGEKSFKVVVR